jgi:hypothetical protein
MKKTVFLVVVLFLVLLFSANCFSQFVLVGEFRPRTEFRHGYKSLASKGSDPAFFTSQRTRLAAGFNSKIVRTGLNIQDIRTWGSTAQLNLTDNHLFIHEAWAEVKLNDFVSVKLGRQELVYDDQRIFGNVGWTQQGRSHDLALCKINYEESINIHFGIAYNQEKEQLNTNFYSVNNYKSMQYLWMGTSTSDMSASFLFLNNGVQYLKQPSGEQAINYSQTTGTFARYNSGSVAVEGSAYYQFGKDVSENKIRAYQVRVQAKYNSESIPLLPLIGLEVLSGTHENDQLSPTFNKNKSFTPFYGTNHKFNGHMDYFFVGNHSNSVGLIDIHAGSGFRMDKYSGNLLIHQFMAHALLNDPANPTTTAGRNLGTEVDLSFGYAFAEYVNISLGYSHMFVSESMEILKGGDKNALQNWAWVMITVTPEFLSF